MDEGGRDVHKSEIVEVIEPAASDDTDEHLDRTS